MVNTEPFLTPQIRPDRISYQDRVGPHLMMDALHQNTPCRDKQITQLYKLLGKPWELFPPCIFLSGHAATGKTRVIQQLLGSLQYNHRVAIVNCEGCYTAKLLFEPILNQITRYEVHSENGYASYAKCDQMLDFITILQHAASKEQGKFYKKKIFIVLKNCEGLRSLDSTLLTSFMHLQQWTDLHITIILMSELVLEKLLPGKALPLLEIHFPQYTPDEMMEILLLNRPAAYPLDFYRNYLNLIVGVFFKDCRSLTEIQRQATLHFPKYCEPLGGLAADAVKQTDVNKLWRHFTPYLRASLDQLHLRMTVRQEPGSLSATHLALSYELPYYSKYLLIAAYLASYNPEKSDAKIFHRGPGKRKRARVEQKVVCAQVLGPKLFTSDRLFAIFYAIIEEKLSLTVNLQSQVATLVKLQLLTVTGEDCIEYAKWRCNVTLDFIQVIAQTVQFNIIKYLYSKA